MSSSDSSDDDLSKFKEAAVSADDIHTKKSQKEDKKNSRRDFDEKKFEGNFAGDVTPEFQNFVAKKLSEIIDR